MPANAIHRRINSSCCEGATGASAGDGSGLGGFAAAALLCFQPNMDYTLTPRAASDSHRFRT